MHARTRNDCFHFLRNDLSVVLAQCELVRRFPDRATPIGQTMWRLATLFEGTGITRGVSKAAENTTAPLQKIDQMTCHAIGH